MPMHIIYFSKQTGPSTEVLQTRRIDFRYLTRPWLVIGTTCKTQNLQFQTVMQISKNACL